MNHILKKLLKRNTRGETVAVTVDVSSFRSFGSVLCIDCPICGEMQSMSRLQFRGVHGMMCNYCGSTGRVNVEELVKNDRKHI